MEDGRTSRRVIAEEAVGRADKALSFGNNAELTVNLLPSWNPLHQTSPTSLFTPYEKLSSSRRVFCAHKFGFYRRIESHLTLKNGIPRSFFALRIFSRMDTGKIIKINQSPGYSKERWNQVN